MQNRAKTIIFGLITAAGLFAAAPAMAQTYNPSYYYPQNTQYTQPYAQPAQNYCPALSYNLVLGSSDYSTHGQVSALQRFLSNRYGVNLVSGYYSSQTASYVSRFQAEMGVRPITGGVGPLTRAAVQRACGSYNPNPYPNPRPSTTFRLDRTFSLYEGQLAELSGGTLDLTLNQILHNNNYGYNYYYYGSNNPTAARITLSMGCRPGTYCIYAPTQSYTLGEGDSVDFQSYSVKLVSLTSQKATFKVTGHSTHTRNATISMSAPRSGDEVNQGDSLRIRWSVNNEPNNSAIVLDLFERGGGRVGTIAIVDGSSASYNWRVPTRHTYCTQQYPNGLCGEDLDGDYYIKASLVEGTGFNGGATLDSDTSDTFTINR